MTNEEAIEAIKCNWPDSRYTILREALDMAISALRQQEHFRDLTKKVEPLVRCLECKHRGTDDCIFHIKGEPADEELLLKLDNDFCSYGERKEGSD